MLPLVEALTHFYEALHRTDKARVLRPAERKLEKAMQKTFRKQGAAFVKGFFKLRNKFEVQESAYLREGIGDDDLDPIFDDAENDDEFIEPIQSAAEDMLLAGAQQILSELDLSISFDLKNPRAVAYLKAHGADLVTKINSTTREYIKTLVTQAMDEGWSYQKTARMLIARYEEFAVGKPQQHIASRAQLIAVTESGNAYEAGNFIPIQDLMDSGIEMEKSWNTMGDNRVSAGCLANEAEGWIPADQEHGSGDMTPLRFPGCRCDELYMTKE